MAKPDPKHPVEIPQFYLLTLAVYGTMGDGEIPKFMQLWAEQECRRLGLDVALAELREKHYQEVRARFANIVGPKDAEMVEAAMEKIFAKLKS